MADVTLDISDKLGTLREQIAKSVSKEVIEAIRKEKIPAGGGTETPRQVPPTKQNQNPTNSPDKTEPKPDILRQHAKALNEKYKKDLVDKTREGYHSGTATASGVQSDIGDLRSGSYDQILSRKMESLAKMKDNIKSLFGKKEEGGQSPGGFGGKGPDSNQPQGSNPNNLPAIQGEKGFSRPIREVRIAKAIIENGDFRGAKGIGGGGSSGGQSGEGKGFSSFLGMAGKNPAMLAAGAAAMGLGAVIGGISQIGQMYSDVLASQEGTMGAVGYEGGGGGLLRNADMAKVKLTRMKYSESGMQKDFDYGTRTKTETFDLVNASNPEYDTSRLKPELIGEYNRNRSAISKLYSQKGSADTMKMIERLQKRQEAIAGETGAEIQSKRVTETTRYMADSNLDVKFGERMGIGGQAGAEMFAKSGFYGGEYSVGEGDRMSSRMTDAKFKELLASGMVAGFKGTRMAEYLKGIVDIQESSYREGYGQQSTGDLTKMISMFASNGMRGERAMAMQSSLTKAAQSKGNSLNSMLLGYHMRQGLSHGQAAARAEEGMTPEHMEVLRNEYFGGNDEMLKEWMFSQNLAKATDLWGSRNKKTGKFGNEINLDMNNMKKIDKKQVNREYDRISGYGGQTHIAQQNRMDNMIIKEFKDVYNVHVKSMEAITEMAGKLTPILNKILSTLGLKGIELLGKVTN